jgi:SpoIID/LytB domain protein
MAVAGITVAVTALVTSVPAQAGEVYARPWDSTVTLSGLGYGHGHGMSQWGAYGAATRGKTWQQIMAFYYPGTKLANLGNPKIRVRLDVVSHKTLYLPTPAGLRLAGQLLPVTIAGAGVTHYRIGSRSVGGLQVDARTSAGWKPYKVSATPAVLSNPLRGNVVDVLLPSGTKRAYRGSIVVNRATATSITPVSHLPMESYLRAVVPAEMPASWHPNAVRAQAVAARSYANFDRARTPAGRTWDTCDTTSCQMYSGVPAEYSASNAAVAATAGQTLTYLGKPTFTQFSAANGGWSADGSKPYLVAKADPYDGAIPSSANSWTASITVARIQARWPSIGAYRQLRILSRDGHGPWGGRVLTAAIDGSKGSVAVTGATIRSAFGLRSEWFVPTTLRSAPSYPRDFSGDRKADVLGVVASTGALRMYAGNGKSGLSPNKVIGTGFRGYSKVLTAGTWDADALSDVIAQKRDGTLWLFPGTAADPVGPGRRIGSGFGVYNLLLPVGDFSGDGRSDLLARRPDGALMLYRGNGSGGFLKGHTRIGSGWAGFTSVFSPGDFNGDRKSDVIARTSAGLLYLYPGNGSGGWLPRRLIGRSWSSFSALFSPGDLNGDGKSDLLARSRSGILWMYPGSGTGAILPRKSMGTGWNIFSTLLL